MSGHDVAVLELHAESGVGQSLDDLTLHLNRIFFRHTALKQFGGRELEHKHRLHGNLAASPAPATHALGVRESPDGGACVLGEQGLKLGPREVRAPRLARWREGSWQSMTTRGWQRQQLHEVGEGHLGSVTRDG